MLWDREGIVTPLVLSNKVRKEETVKIVEKALISRFAMKKVS